MRPRAAGPAGCGERARIGATNSSALQPRSFDEDRVLVSRAEILIGADDPAGHDDLADRACVLRLHQQILAAVRTAAVPQAHPVPAPDARIALHQLAALAD